MSAFRQTVADLRRARIRLRPRSCVERSFGAALLLGASCTVLAQTLASSGCPIYHCTPEATSLIASPIISGVVATNKSAVLGTLGPEGCSGNGTVLACLYETDTAPPNVAGTLKVLDATTLQPIWGSAVAPNSYNPAPLRASFGGQVPLMFADGSLAAGDDSYFVHYDSAGAVIAKLQLRGGTGNDFGLTPIAANLGVISQGGGELTLVDMSEWKRLDAMTLTDPTTQAPINLMVPSSGGDGFLYAIGYNPANGIGTLYVVGVNAENKLFLQSDFSFTGVSGASPVVVSSAVSGLATDLVILDVPGLIGDPTPENRLVGLENAPNGLMRSWIIPLSARVTVTPTIDPVSGSLFYLCNDNIVYQAALATGAPIADFNLQLMKGVPAQFTFNGHIGASQTGSVFTLLLSGSSAPSSGPEYALAFQPLVSPSAIEWIEKISAKGLGYTGAWNFAPASEPGTVCPIIVENFNTSLIFRMCDH
jgi:hypothetical protein